MLNQNEQSISYFDSSSLEQALDFIDVLDTPVNYAYFSDGGIHYCEEFDAGTWDGTLEYQKGSIVTYNDAKYKAVNAVPANTEISNTEYWQSFTNPDNQGNLLFTDFTFFTQATQKSFGHDIQFTDGIKLFPGFNLVLFNTSLYSNSGTISAEQRNIDFVMATTNDNTGVLTRCQRRFNKTIRQNSLGNYTPISFWNVVYDYQEPLHLQLRWNLPFSATAQNRLALRYSEVVVFNFNAGHKR